MQAILRSNPSRGPVHLPSTWLHISSIFLLPLSQPGLHHSIHSCIHSISICGAPTMCLALDQSQPLPWGISHLAKWVWIHPAKSPGDQGMLHRDLSSLGKAFQPEEQHVPSIATRLYPKHKFLEVMSWFITYNQPYSLTAVHALAHVKPSAWVSCFLQICFHLPSSFLTPSTPLQLGL